MYRFSVIVKICTFKILLQNIYFWVKVGNLRVQIKDFISKRT